LLGRVLTRAIVRASGKNVKTSSREDEQLLGDQVEGAEKVIVFVDAQVRVDSLFEQLLRNGYPSLSLHGGKEQEDRDSTLSDF
jgi:superfamily II DNA/RNA helicase